MGLLDDPLAQVRMAVTEGRIGCKGRLRGRNEPVVLRHIMDVVDGQPSTLCKEGTDDPGVKRLLQAACERIELVGKVAA